MSLDGLVGIRLNVSLILNWYLWLLENCVEYKMVFWILFELCKI